METAYKPNYLVSTIERNVSLKREIEMLVEMRTESRKADRKSSGNRRSEQQWTKSSVFQAEKRTGNGKLSQPKVRDDR